ncbi:MAG TPA: ComF family protein [Acidobacteriota bacterium]|nr:ComF family protein [Acidobacteriota bacterium]
MRATTRTTLERAWHQTGRTFRLLVQGLLAPQYCLLCGDRTASPDLRPLCHPCQDALPAVPRRLCDCCGIPVRGDLMERGILCQECRNHLPSFHKACAFGLYQGPLRRLIRAYKFSGLRRLAHPLAELLEAAYRREALEASRLAWVPSHPRRVRERGFDHMGCLAQALAQRCRLPLLGGFQRVRHTPAQSGLSRSQRRRNLKGAFRMAPEALEGPVLLVDDIFTTGATLEEASSTLLRAGASAVEVVTVARVPLYWETTGPRLASQTSNHAPERTAS